MAGGSMQTARSGRPASGSEQLFSQLWEMEGLGHADEEPSHGFKIGLGKLASAALAERLIMQDLNGLDEYALLARWPAWDRVEPSVRGSFADRRIVASAVEESKAKHLTTRQARQRLRVIRRA